MTSFAETVDRVSPVWLRRPVGSKIMFTFGFTLDVMTQHLLEGLRARFPSRATAETLALLGNDRRLDRYPGESDASYRLRLSSSWATWRTAGTAETLLRELRAYLGPVPTIRIVTNSGLWSTSPPGGGAITHHQASPNNWNWDGQTSRWWRFWVIIDSSSGPFAPSPLTGTGQTVGLPGATVGTNATQSQVADIKRIVFRWKPAHAYCVAIILTGDGSWFLPTLPPGDPKLPNGTYGVSTNRSNYARYWTNEVA